MTSKLQVTIPKELADAYRIRPGSEIRWSAAGDAIRLEPVNGAGASRPLPLEKRARLFEEAMRRADARAAQVTAHPKSRGWKREDLYERGRAR